MGKDNQAIREIIMAVSIRKAWGIKKVSNTDFQNLLGLGTPKPNWIFEILFFR